MARGQHARPQSGSVIGRRTCGGVVGDVCEAEGRNGNGVTVPVSPSKMVQGICDDDDDAAAADADPKPGQRVRGYMLQNYTTVQVTNRQKPLPGYPPDYCHDPSSPLPPPGYPLNYVSRKVQVIPDGRGRLTKNIVTQQPQSGVSTVASSRLNDDDDDDGSFSSSGLGNSASTAPSCQRRPSTLEAHQGSSFPSQPAQPFVPPGILGPANEEYSTISKPTTTTGLKSNCTTPGSFSAEWNYEFVHEKSYVYIEALKYSSPNGVAGERIAEGGVQSAAPGKTIAANGTVTAPPPPPPPTTTESADLPEESTKPNVEIYEYLDNDVLVNALCAMPYRGGGGEGNYRYGSVKEKKKKNRDGKISWIESHLNSSSSSSDEKARNQVTSSRNLPNSVTSSKQHLSINASSSVGCEGLDVDSREGETTTTTTTTTTEGLGSSSSGPDASSSSSISNKPRMERKMGSTSKLTGILSRLSPKLIHRRSSSTGKILFTASDSAVSGGKRTAVGGSHRDDSDDAPSNIDFSTSGVSDVSGGGGRESSATKVEENHSSRRARRGRSPVRNFFRKGFAHNNNDDGVDDSSSVVANSSAKNKSPSRNRLLTSFRSASSHKDKEDSKGDRKSDSSSMTSQFSFGRRLRKSSRDVRDGDKTRPIHDTVLRTGSKGGGHGGGGSCVATSASSDCRNVVHQQQICKSEGSILVSSGGGRKYHVVEIPLDDDDDDDNADESRPTPNKAGDADAVVMNFELEAEENPEEEDFEAPPFAAAAKPRITNGGVPPPLPPHGAVDGGCESGARSTTTMTAPPPPDSLRLYPSSSRAARDAAAAPAIDRGVLGLGLDHSRVQDVSIGECSIADMNLSAGSTTVADGSFDYEEDQRLDPYYGSQATLEPDAEARSSTTPYQGAVVVASTVGGAHPHHRYRGVFSPVAGSFQATSSLAHRISPLGSSSTRLQSTPNDAASAAPSVASHHHHQAFSPMSPIGGSSLCSSSVSSQPIPVSSGVLSCHEVKSVASSSVVSPSAGGVGGKSHQMNSLHSNSIGSPPSEGIATTTDPSSSHASSHASSSGSRKPSYLSISMSVSGYSHYRRTGTSLSLLQPGGRTFSSSSLASRGSGSLASVGSSAFSYSTNDASHASPYSSGRAREASGGSGVAATIGGPASAWRGSSVPPLGRESSAQPNGKRLPGDARESIVESSSVEAVPLSACLMDKLCLGCGPASPPSLSASSRCDPKRHADIQQQQCVVPQQRDQRQQQHSLPHLGGKDDQVASSTFTSAAATKGLSSSSSSSSSRRESRAEPFAVSSQQRNTVIRLSPEEPSTATLSTSTTAADRPSSEETTLVCQPEDAATATSSSLEPIGAADITASVRESVVLEAREIVERIKRAERMKLTERGSEGENGTDVSVVTEGKAVGAIEKKQPLDRDSITARDEKRESPPTEPAVTSSRDVPDRVSKKRPASKAEESLGYVTQAPLTSDQINGEHSGDEMIIKDGKYFSNVVLSHEARMQKLCAELESLLPNQSASFNGDAESNSRADARCPANALPAAPVPEDICGKIRACIGKATLLTSKKFKQFKGLCEKNLSPADNDPFPTTDDDLAGFWDMVLIQVEEIDATHNEIIQLKANNWEQKREEKKKPTRRTAKATNEERAAAATAATAARVKAREDARKKLINSKRMQLKQQKLLQNQADNSV